MVSVFALADCNNFYASCERVFQPQFMNKPVIVLSNNDGCVIARSNEAKALGISMGVPYFKIQEIIRKHKIQVFSSNYTLYGLMSGRVMRVLGQFTPHLEVYSIDEAFLDLSLFPKEDLPSYAHQICQRVNQWIGIPLSLGIGPTKTLAKVANKIAKDRTLGSYVLLDPAEIQDKLASFPVQNIWGVGRRWAERLRQKGINTALELSTTSPDLIQKSFNIILARTVLELRGISTLKLEEITSPKKSLVSSRSFGKEAKSYEDLSEAITFHASKIGEKLRKQKSCALTLGCFISTSPFKHTQEVYRGFLPFSLPSPTQDTALLIKHSLKALKEIYREGYKYIKAGVIALELLPVQHTSPTLFEDPAQLKKRQKLMTTFDHINSKYGKGTLIFASEGIKKTWSMKRDYTSPSYLTRWDQVLCVS